MNPTSDTLVCALTRDLPPHLARSALLFAYCGSRVDPECIGWLPRVAYDNRHDRGELLILLRNDDIVGFVLMSRVSLYQELRCLQIWVRPDARMMIHGKTLIDHLERLAYSRGATVLRLWCAEDLAANLFWKQLGFRYRGWRHGPAKKGRRHALWMRRVNPPFE